MHFSVTVNDVGVSALIDGTQDELAKFDAERLNANVRALEFVPDDAHVHLTIVSANTHEYDFPVK